jgi:serine/threonine-protein kinase
MDAVMLALHEALGGRYFLDQKLGEGGMGIVYRAWNPALERYEALKILPPAIATPARRARFLKEAKVAARLTHDHIVPIYAVDTAGPFAYYTMQYIEGVTLEDRIAGEGPLPVADILRILRDVAQALQYAHSRGVVHRDLKPDNILIAREGRKAYVTDFGLARVLSESAVPGGGATFGTCEYISPEQAIGLPAEPRSDVYALGVIGWVMATGKPLFDGTPREVLRQHLTVPAPPLKLPGQDNDMTMAHAVARCLIKDPAQRFQSAGELARDLSLAPELYGDLKPALKQFVSRLQLHSRSAAGALVFALWAITVLGNALDQGHWSTEEAIAGAILAVIVASPLVGAFSATRALVEQGYGQADIVQAIEMTRTRQRKELEKVWGKAMRAQWKLGRKILKACGVLLVVGGAATLSGLGFLPERLAYGPLIFGGLGTAGFGLLVWVVEWQLNQLWGERWLNLFGRRPGRWIVKLARLSKGLSRIERQLPAPAVQPAALPGDPKAALAVVDRAEADVRRGRDYLTTSQAAREREQRPPNEKEIAHERTLEHEVLLLEALLDKFHVASPVSGVPGSLTADLETMREVCEEIERLIEGKEWRP